jgi:hypothetical protein
MKKGMKRDGLVAYRIGGPAVGPNDVRVAEGTKGVPLYSREEWETCSQADYEIQDDGSLTFQGQPSACAFRRVRVPAWARRAGSVSSRTGE